MFETKGVWVWVAAALLCTTIASSYLALDYQSKLTRLQSDYDELLSDIGGLRGDLESLTIKVSIRIDNGEETVWFNDTRVPLNADLLTATQLVASVEYSTGEFGSFVDKIDGVGGDPNTYWVWNYHDEESGGWQYGPVACDAWVLHDGDIVSWSYTGF
jgi:hypothetical protein